MATVPRQLSSRATHIQIGVCIAILIASAVLNLIGTVNAFWQAENDDVFRRLGWSDLIVTIPLAAGSLILIKNRSLGFAVGAVGSLLGFGAAYYQSSKLVGVESWYAISGVTITACIYGLLKVRAQVSNESTK